MKKFSSFYSIFLGVAAGTVALFVNIDLFLGRIGLPVNWGYPIKIVLCILSLICISYAVFDYARKIRFLASIFNNDSAFFQYCKNWFCDKKEHNLTHLQYDMHNKLFEFRENLDEIKDNIKQIDNLTTSEDGNFLFKIFFRELMKYVSVAFKENFHHSISIGIYFLTEKGENMFLNRWITFHEIEAESLNDDNLNSETYIIHSCRRKNGLKDFALNAKNYFNQHDDEEYKKNSMFDYILTTPHNSCISNNVKEDINKGDLYISDSDNIDEYHYNSLAVYAIAPPISRKRKNVPTMGLLTFESSVANAFTKVDSTIILQSFSQIVYEALNEIQK